MSRRFALLLVVAVWAAIYLPSLGLFEIKGEEGRRILPGMAMLETGNYLVPQVGDEDYFRKPPLIN
jgi:4-amino-4-deoxy-L-arabinose transferase-like glycosyltransferase